MQDKTILQEMLQHKESQVETLIANGTKKTGALAFGLLQAFVKGTGDLFDVNLRNKISVICENHDIKGYMELSEQLDAMVENYPSDVDVELVKGHRVLCSLLKKHQFCEKLSPYDPKANAIKKWFDAEDQCKETNVRLRPFISRDVALPDWVHRARDIIIDVIGECVTPEVMREILTSAYHGKGTSTECPFEASSAYFKYAMPNPHSTSQALPYVMAAISRNPRWFANLERSQAVQVCSLPRAQHEKEVMLRAIRITDVERNSFVNKSVKVYRTIGIGNSLNMCVQLGVKTFLTRCMKVPNHSVDLSDQGKNRELAYLASLEGYFADQLGKESKEYSEQLSTLDLASASDTVSLGICQLLLPKEFFALLCDLRHRSGTIDGKTIVYNKMSAMGNGFTFPLESLIFYSILRGTTESLGYEYDISRNAVYGDDMICPYKVTPALIQNLQFAGFSVNTEKSFLTGPFKESCGRDYFQGVNVRPYYIKRALKSTGDLYHVGNSILPRATSDSAVARGYNDMYVLLHATLKDTGHINYGPLSEVLVIDKENNRVWSASETALSVPLSFYKTTTLGSVSFSDRLILLNEAKLNPRMSKKEKNPYITHMLDRDTHLYFNVTSSYENLKWKHVSEETRLLCKFDNERDDIRTSMYEGENTHVQPNGTIKPVVKRALHYVVTMRSHSHWDGILRQTAIEKHPLWTRT